VYSITITNKKSFCRNSGVILPITWINVNVILSQKLQQEIGSVMYFCYIFTSRLYCGMMVFQIEVNLFRDTLFAAFLKGIVRPFEFGSMIGPFGPV
jgi:hypothetical protein